MKLRNVGWSNKDVEYFTDLGWRRRLLGFFRLSFAVLASALTARLTNTVGSSVSALWTTQNRKLGSDPNEMKDPLDKRAMELVVELNAIGLESVAATRLVNEKGVAWQRSRWNLVSRPTMSNLEVFLLSEHGLSLALVNDAKVWIRKYNKERELRQTLEQMEILSRKDVNDVAKAAVIDYLSASKGGPGYIATTVEIASKVPKIAKYFATKGLAMSALRKHVQLSAEFQRRHLMTLGAILERIEERKRTQHTS